MKRRRILIIGLTLTVVLTFLLPNTGIIASAVGEIEDPRSDNITLEYDDNGNLLDDGTNFYTYNVKNQLIEIENQDTGEITSFTYGPLGNRVSSTQHSVTTHHLYNGIDEIQERSSDGSLLREYIPGFAMIDYTDLGSYPTEEAEVLYYFQDVLGSAVALTDVFGNVVEQYYYEPYGETIITDSEGTVELSESAFGNPYMWTGQRYDPENELYHFPARSYSPYLGRFLQPDPLGYVDGMNMYEYVQSSPMVNVDPLGLSFGGIIGGTANYMLNPFCKGYWQVRGEFFGNVGESLMGIVEGAAIIPAEYETLLYGGIYEAGLGFDMPGHDIENSVLLNLASAAYIKGNGNAQTGLGLLIYEDFANKDLDDWAQFSTDIGVDAGLSVFGVGIVNKFKAGGISRLGLRTKNIIQHPILSIRRMHRRNMPFGETLYMENKMYIFHARTRGRKVVFAIVDDANGNRFYSGFYRSVGIISGLRARAYRANKWLPFAHIDNWFAKGSNIVRGNGIKEFLPASRRGRTPLDDLLARSLDNPTFLNAGRSIGAAERAGFFRNMGEISLKAANKKIANLPFMVN